MPQTKEYPVSISTPLPRSSSAKGKDNLHGIESAALALMSELGGANISKIKAVIGQLQVLSGMVGRGGSKASSLQGMINAAIAKAQRQIAELESMDGIMNSADPHVKFEMSVYELMSDRAKAFYHEIDAETHYHLAPVNDNGELVHHAAEKVHGRVLRHHLTLVKFHSFDTASKKQILYESLGAEEAEGEGTPKDKVMLEKKKKQLFALHEALDQLEAYKAYMIMPKYDDVVAADMISNNHEIIMQAHEQIDEVTRKYNELIKDVDNGMAMAMLKVAKLKMKKILREDVIDHVLLEIKPGRSLNGGIGASGVAHNTSSVGFDTVPMFFKPFTD